METKFKSHCDLDLGPTMHIIEIFSYTTKYFNFMFLDPLHTDSDEYSIVAFFFQKRNYNHNNKYINTEHFLTKKNFCH